jgi:hypothetical protein
MTMARNMAMTGPQILVYKKVTGRLHICHFQAQTPCGGSLSGRTLIWRNRSETDRSTICKKCLLAFLKLNH